MLVIKNIEPWAISQVQRFHAEALQQWGERIVFRHRWNVVDFASGRVQRCPVCGGEVRINENQRVRLVQVDSGDFTLTFNGQTTPPILYNQTAEGVRLALLELDDLEPDDLVVTGDRVNEQGVVIEFRGQWAYRNDVPLLIGDDTNLIPTGVGNMEIEILQVVAGAGGLTVRQRGTEVYKQSGDAWCTSCFGVGFEGGFEPIVYVTFALIGDQPAETTRNKSGVVQRSDPMAQFSFEPPVQEFDIIARISTWEDDNITPKTVGGRFLLNEVKPVTARTGPRTADDTISIMPPEYRTRYQMPDNGLIIGQSCQLEVMPFSHQYNAVPLTYHEERLVEMGMVEERTWHIKEEHELETNPRFRSVYGN